MLPKNKKLSKQETNSAFLARLNSTFTKLHTAYEELFWLSNMGDHSVDADMDKAMGKRDAFRTDVTLANEIDMRLKKAPAKEKARLLVWKRFFQLYQAPASVADIKQKVGELETAFSKKKTSRKEGYIDPKTGVFVEASENKMRTMIRTHPDEVVRKACFDAVQKTAFANIDDYITMVGLRNAYARGLGYEDFYAYKLDLDEEITKSELFAIFDDVYEKVKYAFDDIRALEKRMKKENPAAPDLRKPWNFAYMMTGDFAKEEDPYFRFDDALGYWMKSFARMGVDFGGGTITLDLLDRKGKHNNGFCHWPSVVEYRGSRRIPGKSNFTSNAVLGQIGSGSLGLETLFHEGGHAAHLLNSTETEACLNHEYAPTSVSWAEIQSMFMDSIVYDIEWRMTYAKNSSNQAFPFDLFERRRRKVAIARPLGLLPIVMVSYFEKEIYEHPNLTREAVIAIAQSAYRKCMDFSEDSLMLLNLPHIFSWESSAYYHGYALAQLGVDQLRAYFYEKYGHITDNPNIGKDMKKVWKYGGRYHTNEFMKKLTGRPLDPSAHIASVTMSIEDLIEEGRALVARQKVVSEKQSKKPQPKKLSLNARIRLVHGKELIADSSKGLEKMEMTYRKWLAKMGR